MIKYLSMQPLLEKIEEYKDAFATASPFPHIIVEGFLDNAVANEASAIFPDETWDGWNDTDHIHQRYKMACSNIYEIPNVLSDIIYELNSGPFLRYLSDITGIKDLLPDPFLIGGGLHLTRPGGTLTPHIDFHHAKGLPLYRRLNLLVYLHEDWQEGDGGELELWEKGKKKPEKLVPPTLGKMVLFRTDTKSLHGFTNPVSKKNRRSIALYYYTAEQTETYSGGSDTYWQSTSIAKTPKQKMILGLERLFLFGAKVTTSLSWRFSRLAGKMRNLVS